ncbi:MAG: 4Fe-4S binding protein [Thermoplasmatales archaeon]|nr:4Fe-4S binding protein [Thermoplasmatales archaeon]
MKKYEKTGVLSIRNLRLPTDDQLKKGVAIIECVQEIPCNPCIAVCPVNAISMKNINDLPKVDFNKCTGCRRCVGICPGLAIFVVKVKEDKALITLPYEFLPIPKVGDIVTALDREGNSRGNAKVVKVNRKEKTIVITIEVSKDLAMEVRNTRV